jgi:hypothetical protein
MMIVLKTIIGVVPLQPVGISLPKTVITDDDRFENNHPWRLAATRAPHPAKSEPVTPSG